MLMALYGTLEAANLWYSEASKTLTDLGFISCNEDPCIFLKKGIKIGLYVDDFFVIAKERRLIQDLHKDLTKKYEVVKLKCDSSLLFLGMLFRFNESIVSVKIDLVDIVKDIQGISDKPCSMNLFHSKEDSPPLDTNQAAMFHTTVAKLLYISKRTRPDILLPVNILCTRVKAPTKEDWDKLLKVLKYLKSTLDMELLIGITINEDKSINLNSYIDAAYSVHQDLKSHSGACFSIGQGTIMSCSTKQACVSKSSTEAELIAYTDFIGEAMALKNTVQEICEYKVNLHILQDNQSVLSIVTTGKLSGKSKHASKHVKVRVAWIKERSDQKEFTTEYCPTELMMSDGLTKPKSSNDHSIFREMIGVNFPPTFTKERAEDIEVS